MIDSMFRKNTGIYDFVARTWWRWYKYINVASWIRS